MNKIIHIIFLVATIFSQSGYANIYLDRFDGYEASMNMIEEEDEALIKLTPLKIKKLTDNSYQITFQIANQNPFNSVYADQYSFLVKLENSNTGRETKLHIHENKTKQTGCDNKLLLKNNCVFTIQASTDEPDDYDLCEITLQYEVITEKNRRISLKKKTQTKREKFTDINNNFQENKKPLEFISSGLNKISETENTHSVTFYLKNNNPSTPITINPQKFSVYLGNDRLEVDTDTIENKGCEDGEIKDECAFTMQATSLNGTNANHDSYEIQIQDKLTLTRKIPEISTTFNEKTKELEITNTSPNKVIVNKIVPTHFHIDLINNEKNIELLPSDTYRVTLELNKYNECLFELCPENIVVVYTVYGDDNYNEEAVRKLIVPKFSVQSDGQIKHHGNSIISYIRNNPGKTTATATVFTLLGISSAFIIYNKYYNLDEEETSQQDKFSTAKGIGKYLPKLSFLGDVKKTPLLSTTPNNEKKAELNALLNINFNNIVLEKIVVGDPSEQTAMEVYRHPAPLSTTPSHQNTTRIIPLFGSTNPDNTINIESNTRNLLLLIADRVFTPGNSRSVITSENIFLVPDDHQTPSIRFIITPIDQPNLLGALFLNDSRGITIVLDEDFVDLLKRKFNDNHYSSLSALMNPPAAAETSSLEITAPSRFEILENNDLPPTFSGNTSHSFRIFSTPVLPNLSYLQNTEASSLLLSLQKNTLQNTLGYTYPSSHEQEEDHQPDHQITNFLDDINISEIATSSPTIEPFNTEGTHTVLFDEEAYTFRRFALAMDASSNGITIFDNIIDQAGLTYIPSDTNLTPRLFITRRDPNASEWTHNAPITINISDEGYNALMHLVHNRTGTTITIVDDETIIIKTSKKEITVKLDKDKLKKLIFAINGATLVVLKKINEKETIVTPKKLPKKKKKKEKQAPPPQPIFTFEEQLEETEEESNTPIIDPRAIEYDRRRGSLMLAATSRENRFASNGSRNTVLFDSIVDNSGDLNNISYIPNHRLFIVMDPSEWHRDTRINWFNRITTINLDTTNDIYSTFVKLIRNGDTSSRLTINIDQSITLEDIETGKKVTIKLSKKDFEKFMKAIKDVKLVTFTRSKKIKSKGI